MNVNSACCIAVPSFHPIISSSSPAASVPAGNFESDHRKVTAPEAAAARVRRGPRLVCHTVFVLDLGQSEVY